MALDGISPRFTSTHELKSHWFALLQTQCDAIKRTDLPCALQLASVMMLLEPNHPYLPHFARFVFMQKMLKLSFRPFYGVFEQIVAFLQEVIQSNWIPESYKSSLNEDISTHSKKITQWSTCQDIIEQLFSMVQMVGDKIEQDGHDSRVDGDVPFILSSLNKNIKTYIQACYFQKHKHLIANYSILKHDDFCALPLNVKESFLEQGFYRPDGKYSLGLLDLFFSDASTLGHANDGEDAVEPKWLKQVEEMIQQITIQGDWIVDKIDIIMAAQKCANNMPAGVKEALFKGMQQWPLCQYNQHRVMDSEYEKDLLDLIGSKSPAHWQYYISNVRDYNVLQALRAAYAQIKQNANVTPAQVFLQHNLAQSFKCDEDDEPPEMNAPVYNLNPQNDSPRNDSIMLSPALEQLTLENNKLLCLTSAVPWHAQIKEHVINTLSEYCIKYANKLKEKWVIEASLFYFMLEDMNKTKLQIRDEIVQNAPEYKQYILDYFKDGYVVRSNTAFYDTLKITLQKYEQSSSEEEKYQKMLEAIKQFAQAPRSYFHCVTAYAWDNELADGLLKYVHNIEEQVKKYKARPRQHYIQLIDDYEAGDPILPAYDEHANKVSEATRSLPRAQFKT